MCSLSQKERDKNDMVRQFIIYQKDMADSMSKFMSNASYALDTYLQVVVACYSMELEAKDILYSVLSACHVLYQYVKLRGLDWKCPSEVREKLEDKLGPNFMELLGREAMTRAEVLGSQTVEVVRQSLGGFP